mmetsp:Transcript_3624/g.8941  ORF Transcript_3624/g.8941 Transcript_3624/m.8941 type:complete len:189 (-) Transcript_3624:76-642(-)|eukprot:767378-Hanusia_phi.AAC.1
MTSFRQVPMKTRIERIHVHPRNRDHHSFSRGVESPRVAREVDRTSVHRRVSTEKHRSKIVNVSPNGNSAAFVSHRPHPSTAEAPRLRRVMEGSCPYRQENKPIVHLGNGVSGIHSKQNRKRPFSVSRKARLCIRALRDKLSKARWMKVEFEDLLLLISYSMFAASGILALVAVSMFFYDAQISIKSRI